MNTISTAFEPAAAEEAATQSVSRNTVAARLDRLPSSSPVWKMVLLLSLGGFFEFYELFSTAYVLPGMIRSGILEPTPASVFAFNGAAAYVAATFAGLFIGTFSFGFVADKLGRRSVFTYSLLWYSACSILVASQDSAIWLDFWRLMTGIGLGVELVAIDAYLSELVPAHMRGKAFALNQVITYLAVPAVALISRVLVPLEPFGHEGWRWVLAIGAVGSVVVWFLRLGLPESPRWLASAGRLEEADRVVKDLEARVVRQTGRALAAPVPVSTSVDDKRGSFREIWSARYAPRTAMLLIFHVFQTIGIYGFSQWVPLFLTRQGVNLDDSLAYGAVISCVTPLGPLLALAFADKIERKWQIAIAAIVSCIAGLQFAGAREPAAIVACGVFVNLSATIISLNFHAYQAELFPTRVRALAVGFVYSISRVTGIMSSFLIAFVLGRYGAPAALTLIASSMGIVALTIGLLGPKTRGRSLEEINH